MDRLATIVALCASLFVLTSVARPGVAVDCPCPQQDTYVVAPIAEQPALKGIATIIAGCGQFYLNIGAKEGVRLGADLTLMRGGCIIGRARVIKVDVLDSIAQLCPDNSELRVIPGDVALVQNTDPTLWCGNDCRYRRLPGAEATLTSRLPWIEPYDEPGLYEFYELVTLVLIGVTLTNSIE